MSEDPLTLLADRQAIADLVHAYAQGIDRRDIDAVAALFDTDATFVAYATPGAAEPISRRRGRADIAKGLSSVAQYRATAHTIGNHLATVDGDRAESETRCVAYHMRGDEGAENLLVWHLRYLDRFIRRPEGWRFLDRELRVDIVSEQPLHAD